ncbi:MAG: cell division protein CrgA, partial [Nocardioidaceae bacterium]
MSASRPSSRTGKTKRSRPASNMSFSADGSISVVRTAAAAALVLLGIVWLVVYVTVAGPDTDGTKLTWMGDLDRWNYLIGFGLVWLGLVVAANKSTPLGRGRGVVIGMLGSFLIGLVWIVVYYVTGSDLTLPLFTDLGQYNL